VKILVTGAAGFIGSHLCDRLVQRGHSVTAVDNLSLGRRAHLAQLDSLSDFRFAEMDVADVPQLNALFEAERFDSVFHMAANSDIARSHANPETDFGNTLRTTYAVLEAMRRNGVRQIVFASTSAIYGEAQGRVREDYGPLLPISHYGAAKLASEAFISSYGVNYGIRAWIARFPNVVGERATHGAVYDFVHKLRRTPGRLQVLGDGTQVKPYLHVADLLDGILLAWDRMDEQTSFFNLGGTTRCTVRRMAEIVVEESGQDAVIDYTGGDRGWIGDVPSVDYDTNKIRALGWEPKLDSEAAVRRAARWMLEQSP
jgi:UDP-glucose 4-epimerase